ncbi:hypothetical protein, partial [Brevundimonas sp.]|uniref:hypothetical protein n=1 Tax=Brevundimonas sp. TaxID=1871086 RepID=UPI00391B797B
DSVYKQYLQATEKIEPRPQSDIRVSDRPPEGAQEAEAAEAKAEAAASAGVSAAASTTTTAAAAAATATATASDAKAAAGEDDDAASRKRRRKSRWGDSGDADGDGADGDTRQRRSRWASDAPAAPGLTPEQLKLVQLRMQLETLNRRLLTVAVDAAAKELDPNRSPSPPPQYDGRGKRVNT